MKVVVPTALPFSEWLKTVSPPPIVVSKRKLKGMSEAQRAELETTNKRRVIDPVRVNQFIDSARAAGA